MRLWIIVSSRPKPNKGKLLQVLSPPPRSESPPQQRLELAVRRRVRKRDVSFGPRSPAGVRAWDTFQSIAATGRSWA